MAELESRVAPRTPNQDASGATGIPEWKFNLLRSIIFAELSRGDVMFSELASLLAARIKPEDKIRLGSLGWHVATVKLELAVRGEIQRVPGKAPQILTLG